MCWIMKNASILVATSGSKNLMVQMYNPSAQEAEAGAS